MKKKSIFTRSRAAVTAIFLLFAVCLLIMHRYVYLYFDDYGYAALTYGYEAGDGGTDWTAAQLFDFLRWHYLNWGGRVLPFLLEILCLSRGVGLIRIVQCLAITGIYVLIFLLSARFHPAGRSTVRAFATVSLYASVGILTMRCGTYWFTASVLYVWPALLFFLLVYLDEAPHGTGATALRAAVAFFAGFSYEQYAVMVFVFSALSWLRHRLTDKKASGAETIVALSGMAGALCEILAPGNFVRSGSSLYESFYSEPFLSRTFTNILRIIQCNLSWNLGNQLLAGFLLIASASTAVRLINEGAIRRGPGTWDLAAHAAAACLYVLNGTGADAGRLNEGGICLAIACLFAAHTLAYVIRHRQFALLPVIAAGLCSQGMMIVSPTIQMRCTLPFLFVLHLLIAAELPSAELPRTARRVIGTLTAAAVLVSWANFAVILNGYRENAPMQEANDAALREASRRYAGGEKSAAETVTLFKLKNDLYACEMPYQSELAEVWCKQYYDLPQSTVFLWEDTM